MDKEFLNRLKDRFEGFELVEYLQIDIEDVISAFDELIEENFDDLEEFITYGR